MRQAPDLPDLVVAGEIGDGFAEDVSQKLKVPLVVFQLLSFSNGDEYVRILRPEESAGKRVALVWRMGVDQSAGAGELYKSRFLRVADAFKQARDVERRGPKDYVTKRRLGASQVIGVMPYHPGSRQDKYFETGVSNTVAWDLSRFAGVLDGFLTVSPHYCRQGSISFVEDGKAKTLAIPSCAVDGTDAFLGQLKAVRDPYVLVPDESSGDLLGKFKARLGCDGDYVKKHREGKTVRIEYKPLDVGGKTVVIPDDVLATGATLLASAEMAMEQGAAGTVFAVVHDDASGEALRNLSRRGRVIFTNTRRGARGVEIADVSGLVAGALAQWGEIERDYAQRLAGPYVGKR